MLAVLVTVIRKDFRKVTTFYLSFAFSACTVAQGKAGEGYFPTDKLPVPFLNITTNSMIWRNDSVKLHHPREEVEFHCPGERSPECDCFFLTVTDVSTTCAVGISRVKVSCITSVDANKLRV